MNDSNIEIINQLKCIKKWIAVASLGFLLIGVGVSLFSVMMIQLVSTFEEEFSEIMPENENDEFSWESASKLFQQNKTEELAIQIEERLVTHPNDPTAFWFMARIHSLNREWDLAIEGIEKTELLAPNWRNEYTQPLRQSIENLRK